MKASIKARYTESMFLSDFGVVPITDPETVAALNRVPKKTNGDFDYRYRMAKRAASWHRAANAACTEAYMRGDPIGGHGEFVVPLPEFRI